MVRVFGVGVRTRRDSWAVGVLWCLKRGCIAVTFAWIVVFRCCKSPDSVSLVCRVTTSFAEIVSGVGGSIGVVGVWAVVRVRLRLEGLVRVSGVRI